MNNRMRTAAVIGRLFGRRVWTPAALPGLIAAPMFHLMQAAGCLWQDNAKTTPASVGEPVYRTRCTFTGKEFAAASNAGRVVLSDEGSGRRAGVWDGGSSNCLFLTGSGAYPVTVVVAVRLAGGLTRANDVIGLDSASTDNFNALTYSEYTAKRWHNGSSGFGRTPDTVTPADETDVSGWQVMTWMIGNGDYRIYKNGVLLRQSAAYTWRLPADPVWVVGRRESDTYNATHNGGIAGWIIASGLLADADRRRAERYAGAAVGVVL
jgi:hypothetical protein